MNTLEGFKFEPAHLSFSIPIAIAAQGLAYEKSQKDWAEYQNKYLIPLELKESQIIYELALEEALESAEGLHNGKENASELTTFMRGTLTSALMLERGAQFLADRLWAAGFLFERPHITIRGTGNGEITHERSASQRVIVWRVRKRAPRPPASAHPNIRPVPSLNVALGSNLYTPNVRGRRAAPSQLESKPLLSLGTAFPLSYSITALNQRAAWTGAEQGAFKVERGYLAIFKKEKVQIVYFLGELEFEDDLHPQPFGAAQATEILKRWGPLHSFLHAGLCVALSESHGHGVELGEKDLLFLSGLKASVEKGDTKKSIALERISAALKDLGTLSAAVRSSDKRTEIGRFPLFTTQPIIVSEDGEARSIAAYIAPGHFARKFFGYDSPDYAIPRELFTLPMGLPSWLGIWLTANVWRFSSGRRIPLRKVLEGAIPQVKPEHAEEWEGHSITWAELEPTEHTARAASRMKECRKTLREQLSRAERLLAAHNIVFKIHGNRRIGTRWEAFLDSPTSLSIVGVEKRPPLLDRVLEASQPESRLTGETIKAALKAEGMKQGELAKALGISAAVITRWLKPESDSAHRPVSPKHEARIRDLLKID